MSCFRVFYVAIKRDRAPLQSESEAEEALVCLPFDCMNKNPDFIILQTPTDIKNNVPIGHEYILSPLLSINNAEYNVKLGFEKNVDLCIFGNCN